MDSLRDEFQVPERGRELNLPLIGNVELFRNQITCFVETLQHRQGGPSVCKASATLATVTKDPGMVFTLHANFSVAEVEAIIEPLWGLLPMAYTLPWRFRHCLWLSLPPFKLDSNIRVPWD